MLTNSMPILFILSGQVWHFALTDLLWSRSTSNAKNSRWEANSSSGKDANPIGHWKRDIEEDTSESDCLWNFKGIPDFYIWCIICLCCFCQTGETQTARKPGLIKKTVAYLEAGIIGGGLGQGCLKVVSIFSCFWKHLVSACKEREIQSQSLLCSSFFYAGQIVGAVTASCFWKKFCWQFCNQPDDNNVKTFLFDKYKNKYLINIYAQNIINTYKYEHI